MHLFYDCLINSFLDSDSFLIAYHNSLVDVQTNYCNNNLLILNVKQLNKIMKLFHIYTLKTLWDVQGEIKMYYGMSRVKKQLLGKKSIVKKLWNQLKSILSKNLIFPI